MQEIRGFGVTMVTWRLLTTTIRVTGETYSITLLVHPLRWLRQLLPQHEQSLLPSSLLHLLLLPSPPNNEHSNGHSGFTTTTTTTTTTTMTTPTTTHGWGYQGCEVVHGNPIVGTWSSPSQRDPWGTSWKAAYRRMEENAKGEEEGRVFSHQ